MSFRILLLLAVTLLQGLTFWIVWTGESLRLAPNQRRRVLWALVIGWLGSVAGIYWFTL